MEDTQVTIFLTHAETKETVEVIIVATANNWAYTNDGYYYDLRYWRQDEKQG